jgi:lipopolysaccharide export system ATP-binding protein
VVQDVSLDVTSGEVVGLLGPNGAGKTTSFYMIVGLVRADAGSIRIDGQAVEHMPIHRRSRLGLSYLPQEASIFRKLTVAENVRAVLELQHDETASRWRGRDRAAPDRAAGAARAGAARLARAGAVGRRAPPRGDRPRAGHAAALHPAGRALCRHRPDRRDRDPAHHRFLKARGIGVLITDHNVRETLGICDHASSSARAACWPGTPTDIVANPDVRRVYLGEHFRL